MFDGQTFITLGRQQIILDLINPARLNVPAETNACTFSVDGANAYYYDDAVDSSNQIMLLTSDPQREFRDHPGLLLFWAAQAGAIITATFYKLI